jgi:transcriptional regulator with XRE-family HTH domain
VANLVFMIRLPKTWREQAGLSCADVARRCGIAGKNPTKTYSRYETGESPAPALVIEAVRKLSAGKVDAETFQRARLSFLKLKSKSEAAA